MKRKLLPTIIIIAGVVLVAVLGKFNKKPSKEDFGAKIPTVKTQKFPSRKEIIYLKGSGTISPEKSISLIPQVAGKITEVSENMKEGHFFEKGDTLFKIDDTDYRLRLSSLEALVLQRKTALAEEERNCEIAAMEWEEFHKENPEAKPDSLTLRLPMLKLAEANLKSAEAQLSLAKLNLKRTVITAPFAGVSVSRNADVGQFVAQGSILGKIYGTDKAKAVIPVKNEDSAKAFSDKKTYKAVLKNGNREWEAKIIGKEVQLDPRTRMINLIAEIEEPLKKELPFGTFVVAEIEGKYFENIIKIPRFVLRNDNRVPVAQDGKIKLKKIDILKIYDSEVYVKAGLDEDDEIIVSRIDIATENMPVKVERNR